MKVAVCAKARAWTIAKNHLKTRIISLQKCSALRRIVNRNACRITTRCVLIPAVFASQWKASGSIGRNVAREQVIATNEAPNSTNPRATLRGRPGTTTTYCQQARARTLAGNSNSSTLETTGPFASTDGANDLNNDFVGIGASKTVRTPVRQVLTSSFGQNPSAWMPWQTVRDVIKSSRVYRIVQVRKRERFVLATPGDTTCNEPPGAPVNQGDVNNFSWSLPSSGIYFNSEAYVFPFVLWAAWIVVQHFEKIIWLVLGVVDLISFIQRRLVLHMLKHLFRSMFRSVRTVTHVEKYTGEPPSNFWYVIWWSVKFGAKAW